MLYAGYRGHAHGKYLYLDDLLRFSVGQPPVAVLVVKAQDVFLELRILEFHETQLICFKTYIFRLPLAPHLSGLEGIQG